MSLSRCLRRRIPGTRHRARSIEMIDPLARYDLVKLHVEQAQKEAQQQALAPRAPFTMWPPLLNAAARLWSLARRTPPAAARCDQAYCAAGC